MSLLEVKKPNPNIVLGLWKIEESFAELRNIVESMGYDLEELKKIKHSSKKKQWLSSRVLLSEISNGKSEIAKDDFGKPHLTDEKRGVSISHSHEMVGLILNKEGETGIDIQKFNPKIERIKFKFASDRELQLGKEENNSLTALHVIWGAKESIYKYYGRKELLFKENILIESMDLKGVSGKVKARIQCPGMKRNFELEYEKIEDYLLVYILK